MGCTSSKQEEHSDLRRDFFPSRRRVIDRFKGCAGGGYQVVSLKSSTLGTIKLDRSNTETDSEDEDERTFWSDMIERKMQKPPAVSSPNEPAPEIINVWELMEGLDDDDDDDSTIRLGVPDRSFSFDAILYNNKAEEERTDPKEEGNARAKVVAPVRRRKSTTEMRCDNVVEQKHSLVQERIRAFQEKINAKKKGSNRTTMKKSQSLTWCPPGGRRKVVVYFTSLRGIRKTYEDCCDVQTILRGYGVRMDERDVSMHAKFKEELNQMLGPGRRQLPRVFAAGTYLGGAEEVRNMHESGKLDKALEDCDRSDNNPTITTQPCELCDDMRFVPCETCSGSCKLYVDVAVAAQEDPVQHAPPDQFAGFRRCPDCNENGLVRCPICCDD